MEHPVDSRGLVLPEPSWPDARGSAGPLEPLRRFCNTVNRENGADAWRTPAELAAWLSVEGHASAGTLTVADVARLVALREALFVGIGTGDLTAFAALVGARSVRIAATADGGELVPATRGLDAVVTRLALAVAITSASGELRRLKSCDHCRWVFHDTSKNRAGRWCSMAACGGRDKARSYRRRRADGGRLARP
jgi:predicted RNA-binding Zn ribbon-like protein